MALGIKMSTPNFMVYGELGRVPLSITIYKRMIAFWRKTPDDTLVLKLNSIIKNILSYETEQLGNHSKWLNHIKHILDVCGLSYMFNNIANIKIEMIVENILHDQYLQEWKQNIEHSSKGSFYKLFKNTLKFEPYLLLQPNIVRPLLKFRTLNHKLPIETGRWENTPRENRTCKHCTSPAVADEQHYLFNCESIHQYRTQYLAKYISWSKPVSINRILNLHKTSDLKNVSRYLNHMFSLFK